MHITSVCISIDNKVLATASKDGTVKLWSLPDASLLTIFKGHADWVTAVSISPDLMLLASGSKDNTIRLWYFPEGEPNRCIFDYAISDYTHVKKYREMGAKTHTLPCGKPVPSGAVCECDCVAGMVRYKGIETVCTCDAISVDRATVLPEEVGCYCDTVNVGVWNSGHGTSDCYSHKICSCDSVCSCVGHTSRSRGGHYWRPN